LGWQTIRTSKPDTRFLGKGPKKTYFQSLIMGLLITLGNSKAIIFYVGFLPTFINLTTLKLSDVFIIITALTIILYLVIGSYCYFAHRTQQLIRNPKTAKKFNLGAGGIMIGTGVVIMTR